VFAVHKANLAVASHTLHIENSNFSWNKYTLDSLFSVKTALNQNATGGQMLAAIEINFAGWGMIVCAAMEIAQYFEAF